MASVHHIRKIIRLPSAFYVGRRARSLSQIERPFSDQKNAPKHSYERYAANGGTIEGVWVFHRHGDRAPSTPLCFQEDIETESNFWKAKLPPSALMDDLEAKFPLKLHKSWGNTHLDSPRYPWGALTMLGAMQMHHVGDKFYHRYTRYPFDSHLAPSSASTKKYLFPDAGRFADFLAQWDIICYSTNYLRTVTSARAFLDGLLFGRSNPHFKEYGSWRRPSEFRHAARYPGRFTLGPQDFITTPDIYEPSASYVSTGLSSSTNVTCTTNFNIPINVRTKQSDPLNAFDRNFDLMMDLIKDVVSQKSFQEGDSSAVNLATKLINELPGLKNSVRFGGPSGINWVHAADHFVCRSSHGMKLSGLEPLEDSNHSEYSQDPLQELCGPTMKHLAWRFRQWYTSAPLLAEFAGPPLREVVRHAKLCLEASRNPSEPSLHLSEQRYEQEPHIPARNHRPFVVYSCHDVSILSLLYGIRAKLVVDDHYSRYWPPYASTLVFELLRISDSDEPYIRVLLNGKPVAIHGNPIGNIISFQDFGRAVEDMVGGRELTVHPHDPSVFVSSRHGGVL